MFQSFELVSESTELMSESFEHRFIHKKQNKFIINRKHLKMFSTCTVEITQYALNQRSPARSGKVKGRRS